MAGSTRFIDIALGSKASSPALKDGSIFLIPAIFYLVEKWLGAGKENAPSRVPATPAPAAGD